MLLTILFTIFLFAVGIQFFFYTFFFVRLAIAKQNKTKPSTCPVSVIVAAKNESENLRRYLPFLLEQDYKTYEVIVVNDASEDKSMQVLENFQKSYGYLKVLHIPKNTSYSGNKKNAITMGIKAASFDYLLFTDADCMPASKNWIAEMAGHFDQRKQLVLGYSGYFKRSKSFLNKLIRFETLVTAIQYFSYAQVGLPYMGVGRNLAYKKDLFNSSEGFKTHSHIKSGDDDLFVNSSATSENTTFCINKDGFTLSEPKKDWPSWWRQKRRHLTTAYHYSYKHQLLLGLFFLSQLLFWVLAIFLLLFSFKWQLIGILVSFRLIFQLIIYGACANKFHEKDLILLFPILDFVLVILQMGLFLHNLIKKPSSW